MNSLPAVDSTIDLRVRDLGRMAYGEALALQRQLQREVIESRQTRSSPSGGSNLAHLLLVEHDPPVITVSRRPGARQHLLATPAQLAAAGVEVAETDRGGDITYHGPGQLVVYPIIDLNRFGFRIDSYMRFLEQAVIDTLQTFGIEGARDSAATGVWVRSPSPRRSLPRADAHGLPSVGANGGRDALVAPQKICALGVRVSRWVSMHGLALNVATNLDHFNLIVPCGLAERGVTSMQRIVGEGCPSMDAVKQAFVMRFAFSLNAIGASVGHGSGGPFLTP